MNRCLVVAKAPVAGLCKTRLAADIGYDDAAALASAALLDTLETVTATFGADDCVLALIGDLDGAVDGDAIRDAVAGWTIVPQRGDSFGQRLAHAHADAGAGPLLQIGMDTPQLTSTHLTDALAGLTRHDAVLAPAEDGGWWGLALRDPGAAGHLRAVPMSTPDTGRDTRQALESAGLSVATTTALRDVDTLVDAEAVARLAPDGRFAATWHGLQRERARA
ncbi:MAG: TIGR04282 family arsenosugar biosynthesis glycosyltransferase [Nocardioides sp.]